MRHLITEHPLDHESCEVLTSYFDLDRLMIFDIETTGLSPATSEVILIGCITFKENRAYVHQLFADNPTEESNVLELFKDLSKDCLTLVNFNGSSFDIPYLNKRYLRHGMTYRIHKGQSFDLYRICKASDLPVENHKLKTLEAFLGIAREDTISGKESIMLYNHYVKTQNQESLDKVLGHNYEDILHLIPFMEILKHMNPNLIQQHLTHYLNIEQQTFYLTKATHKKDFCHVDLSMANPILYRGKDLHYYDPCVLSLVQGVLHVEIPVFQINTPEPSSYLFADVEKMGWFSDFNALALEVKMRYLIKENASFNYGNLIHTVKEQLKSLH